MDLRASHLEKHRAVFGMTLGTEGRALSERLQSLQKDLRSLRLDVQVTRSFVHLHTKLKVTKVGFAQELKETRLSIEMRNIRSEAKRLVPVRCTHPPR